MQTTPTTFNMRTDLRSRAKLYIAKHNILVEEKGKKTEKENLSKLLNEAMELILKAKERDI